MTSVGDRSSSNAYVPEEPNQGNKGKNKRLAATPDSTNSTNSKKKPQQSENKVRSVPLPQVSMGKASATLKPKPILKKSAPQDEGVGKINKLFKKKEVQFKEEVLHRQIFDKEQADESHTTRTVEQKIPLVDESQNAGLHKNEITLEDATHNLELHKAHIQKWKQLEEKARPRGKNSVGTRLDRAKTEKALSKRDSTSINRANFSSSWLLNLSRLECQAYELLTSKGVEITPHKLIVQMIDEASKPNEEVFTFQELKEIAYDLSLYKLYQATEERPGIPPTFIDSINLSEEKLVEFLTEDMPDVIEIRVNDDNQYTLVYNRVSNKEITTYVNELYSLVNQNQQEGSAPLG